MKRTFLLLLSVGCNSDKGVTAFNPPPEVRITSHMSGDDVYEGMASVFQASVSDLNHDFGELTVSWSSDSRELCPPMPPDTNGDSICVVALLDGETAVSAEVRDPENGLDTDSVSLNVVATFPPLISIYSPFSSGVYYTDRLILFEGNASDAEDDNNSLSLSWESSIDGILEMDVVVDDQGDFSSSGTLSLGEHALTAMVEDSSGKTAAQTIFVDVGPPNTPPSCEILSPDSGLVGVESEILHFEALVSDADISPDQLQIIWSSDKDGELGNSTASSSGEVLFSYGDLSVNTHTITMTVTDEIDTTCTDLLLYTVGTPPTAIITEPLTNALFNEGEIVTFVGQVSDNEDLPDQLMVTLESSLDGELIGSTPTSNGEILFSTVELSSGIHTLTLRAVDTDGLTASDLVNVVVNGVPTMPTLTISPNPASTEDTLLASATGSTDPEGSAITYDYEWLLNGGSTGITGSMLPSLETSKHQIWTVRATPNDGITDGPLAETTITIENTPPVVDLVSITPNPPTTHDVLSCSATWTDPDETPNMDISWSHDGISLGNTSQLQLSPDIISPDDVVICTVEVTDSDEETASLTTSTTIQNTAPQITSLTIDPNTGITTATELHCNVQVVDTDEETVDVIYQWTNSSGVTLGNDSQLNLTPDMIQPTETVTCSAEVSDGFGGTDIASETVTIDNTPPEISVSLNTNTAQSGDSITCNVESTDPDGGEPTITISWTVAGQSYGSGASISLFGVVAGDTVICNAVAEDLNGGQVSGSAELTVANSAPTISSVLIDPPQPYSYDNLTCLVQGNDLDGNTINWDYVWTINEQTTDFGNQINGPFYVGDDIKCTVVGNDGFLNSSEISAEVTVQNSLPVVDSVILSPSAVYTDDPIEAIISLSDADQEHQNQMSATYTWHVDSSIVLETSSVLQGSNHFEKNQTVYVEITPQDGLDSGLTVNSSSIIISNSPPEAPTIYISPEQPVAGHHDIECLVEQDSYDADGDFVSYSFEWTVDTDPTLALTSESISGNQLLPEEIWTCSVTPNDGTDDGISTQEDVEILGGCAGLEFDGVDDGAIVEDDLHLQLDGLSALTLESWIYNYGMGGTYRNILRIGDLGAAGRGILMRLGSSSTPEATNNRLEIMLGTDTIPDTYLVTTPVVEDRWMHVAAVYDGSELRLYVDGFLEASTSLTGSITVFDSGSGIGIRPDTHNEVFYGILGKTRISDTVRYSNDFTPATLWNVDSSTIAQWNPSGAGSIFSDVAGTYNAIIDGASWIESCPEEDYDSDGAVSWQDCNDENPAIHPSAQEICDGIDNDCDGLVDTDDDSLDLSSLGTFYQDLDSDGYGDPDFPQSSCSQPNGYVSNNVDCRDDRYAVHPYALEICDYIDNDCDNDIDDADSSLSSSSGNTYYRDSDGDTYGNSSISTHACSKPNGYVLDDDDCNDNNASIHPGATETPNDGIDQDCEDGDLIIDEDVDNDGYTESEDCNDDDATIHPNATEIPNDGIDQDCEDGDLVGDYLCDDSCSHSNDNICDDGGDPALPFSNNTSYSFYDSCDFGTDCSDCGVRPACTNTCTWDFDGECDDGRFGDYAACYRGTDCGDCGSY